METEFIKEIFNKEKSYPKIETGGYLKKKLGDGLIVTAESEKWAKLRKIANHAFRIESIRSMTPAMVESADMMLERWKQHEGKEIEVYEEFRLFASEVISRTAFGSSYVEGKGIFEKLNKLTLMAARNTYKIRLPGLSQFFRTHEEIKSEELEQEIRESIIRIIKKREKETVDREVDSFGNDYLGLLLKANRDADDRSKITVDDVVDNCKNFFFAGHETTTSLLAWTFLLLGIHTDWQEKARQEVLSIFGQQQPDSDGL